MEAVNLNIIPGKAWPVCHASQFDIGRVIRFNLFEGVNVFTLDGDETVTVSVKKPDGNVVTAAVVNTSLSYVEVVTTEQMTACDGASLCELKIEKDDDVIGSLNFILEVEVDPLKNGIESASEIHNLQEQIGEAVADQYAAEDVIFDAVPTAGHGVGFAVTSEGVLNAIPDELNDLGDVDISGAAQGEALVWDGSKWVNGTVSTVGSIDDLNDVDTTGKANADSLRYNATAQEWEAKPTTVEMTLAEYEALGGDYSGYENTNIIITDAPNLNATAQDISYDGSTATVYDVLKIIDITNDYITMASGYTFISGKVYKQGKHIFGNIVLSGTLQGGNNTDTLGTIKSDYRTADPINGFCGISNGQWFTNNIGYVYIASSGGLQVATTPTGMTYAKIHIDYVTA